MDQHLKQSHVTCTNRTSFSIRTDIYTISVDLKHQTGIQSTARFIYFKRYCTLQEEKQLKQFAIEEMNHVRFHSSKNLITQTTPWWNLSKPHEEKAWHHYLKSKTDSIFAWSSYLLQILEMTAQACSQSLQSCCRSPCYLAERSPLSAQQVKKSPLQTSTLGRLKSELHGNTDTIVMIAN